MWLAYSTNRVKVVELLGRNGRAISSPIGQSVQ
jgi:hypothetical protein